MLNQTYIDMCSKKSVIRELFAYGSERAKEIGYENVFDYSLGNPSVPAPESFTKEMIRLLNETDPVALHGYSPTLGNPAFKEAVAKSLNERFGMNYEAKHIFPTSGAAGAIAHATRAVTVPGDEVLTFAPFFPEYNPYINTTGAVLKVVPADVTSFQINFDEFERMLNPKVAAVLINTPNNPSGIVYSEETIKKLAAILTDKEKEFGHPIYIISDEPYREIVFEGFKAPYIAKYYNNTVTCYSFSKSISLPGERIGYVAVSPNSEGADVITDMCGQISRGTGHNCPSSIIQMAVIPVLNETSDLSVYETNSNILYNELTNLGFEIVKPGGTFYMFPKSPIEDANEFSAKAKEFDLLLVPSDTFGVKSHFRISYCINTEKVERSLDAFKKLAAYYRM